jgi:hypothetical protein
MKTFTGHERLTAGSAIQLLLNRCQEILFVKGFYVLYNSVYIVKYLRYLSCARFLASAPVELRPSFFWDVTRRWLVAGYQRFGTAYRSNFQGSNSPKKFFFSCLPTDIWNLQNFSGKKKETN